VLRHDLLHPEILAALAAAGHGSRVLIADGNFPAATALGPRAKLVSLNLSPGVVSVPQVLRALVTAVPIEAAHVMATLADGPYAMDVEPPVWADYRSQLAPTDAGGVLQPIERFAFYEAARSGDVALTVQTADQELYANLLLTIGVRRAPATDRTTEGR